MTQMGFSLTKGAKTLSSSIGNPSTVNICMRMRKDSISERVPTLEGLPVRGRADASRSPGAARVCASIRQLFRVYGRRNCLQPNDLKMHRPWGGEWPASTAEIAEFAINKGLFNAPRRFRQFCARELAKAMREEYITDSQGRPVRKLHAARFSDQTEAGVRWTPLSRPKKCLPKLQSWRTPLSHDAASRPCLRAFFFTPGRPSSRPLP